MTDNLHLLRRLAWITLLVATGSASLGERNARADQVAAQLDYVAVAACPNAAQFESVVAERLGYSPFRADASERVVIRIEASGRTLEGRLEWRSETGGSVGERMFPSRSGDCGELVRAMGFALALQFQLLATAAPPPPSPPPPPVVVAPPPAPPPVAITAQPRPPAVAMRPGPSIAAGAGASASLGLSPNAAALGRVFGNVAWQHAAIQLELAGSVPSTTHRADGAGFSHQVFLAGVAGCGLLGRWGACLLANVGQIRVVGEGIDVPTTSTGLLVQGGLRVALAQRLGQRAYLVIHGDGVVSLTRGIVTLDSMAIWTTPRVAGLLGLDFGVRFQ